MPAWRPPDRPPGRFASTRDVLAARPPDLLFVEAAVNDDQDEQLSAAAAVRGMEGIVRHVRRAAPQTDIVMIHFANPALLQAIQEGRTPVSIAAHQAVAARYGIPTVNVAAELAAGAMSWQDYGGTHPQAAGHAFAAHLIEEALTTGWRDGSAATAPHPLPKPLDPHSYAGGTLVEPQQLDALELAGGFGIGVPDWHALPGATRSRFRDVPLLSATQPGATASFNVRGRAIGAFVLAGPDAGIVEVTIDDRAPQQFDLRHEFSAGLHYPRTMIFAPMTSQRACTGFACEILHALATPMVAVVTPSALWRLPSISNATNQPRRTLPRASIAEVAQPAHHAKDTLTAFFEGSKLALARPDISAAGAK